jgi:outer membrane protein assembly factor BamB
VNAENPPWFRRPSGAMHVFVHRQLTAQGRTVGEDWERGRPEIDPAHDRVFVGSADRGLYALRAGDGTTIWRFETLGLVQSEPLYDPELDYVYFGSHDGALYCVKAHSGELVYRFDTGAEVSRKPVRLGEMLYFANAADFVFAIERRTGKPRWQNHRTPALGMEISGHAGPSVDESGNVVFMAFSDGHVVGYDARDGSERWTPVDLSAEAEESSGETPRYLDVDTTPVVDEHPQGRVIYVSSYAGGVFALDASSGARVWSNTSAIGVTDLVLFREPAHEPHPNGPDANGPSVPERKLVLVASATSGLSALDPYTGRLVWRNKVPEGGVSAPVPMAGAILVGTTRYGLFLMSPRNGKVIDGFDLGTGIAQTPATFAGRAYVMTNTGTFIGVAVAPPIAPKKP